MFGWRKRKDGFVWQEYVRTTILVRREQRRQRIEEVRLAAVDGLKQAGQQGVAIGAAAASSAGRGLWAGLRSVGGVLWDWIVVGTEATGLWLKDRLNVESAPAATLALIGAAAGLAGVVRLVAYGFDRDAVIAVVVALIAGLGLAAPRLAPHFGGVTGAAAAALRRVAAMLPSGWNTRLPAMPHGVAGVVAGGVVLGLALYLALGWLGPALLSRPTETAGVPAKPLLEPASGRIEGKAVASGPAELKVGTETVRLFGVEAPDASQKCTASRPCVTTAKQALQKLVTGKRVVCDVTGKEGVSDLVGTCQINGADIAGQMVRGGHLFSATGLFATYAGAEREAKGARAGLWRTNTARPAEHRAQLWEDAKEQAPNGCPIKGIQSGDGRTYLLPWSPAYARTKVRVDRGDRWFCTEAEAQSAGWRAAPQF